MSPPKSSGSITATSTLSSLGSGLDMKEPSQLADRLTTSRNELIETGYYLGDPSNHVHQNVVWRRVGRCHKLYTKPYPHYEATTTTALQHDDTSPTPSHTLSQSSTSTQPAAPPSPEPAILYAVVTIGYASFITPCGNWKGPTEFTKSFADVKLSLRGVCPSVESVFHNDFETSIDNAQYLMGQVATPNVRDKGFVTVPPETTAEEFRFRHALFDQPHSMSDCQDSELDEIFSLSSWPIIHPAAKEARDLMLLTKSHRLLPVPAYDLNGCLIPPQDYRTILPGSVARIAFTLTHWFIDERYNGIPASNTFTADLVSLRVLIEPPPKTPRRRARRTDPGLESPTKRARII